MQYRDFIQSDPKQVKEGEEGFSPSIKLSTQNENTLGFQDSFFFTYSGTVKTVMTSAQKITQVHSSHSAGDLTHCKAHANLDLG